MKISKNCGIYVIKDKDGKIRYVGQSVNLNVRFREHVNCLKRNEHYNSKIQRYFNKYGESSINYEIILNCPVEYLDEIETALIEQFKTLSYMHSRQGWNLTTGGQFKYQKVPEKEFTLFHSEFGLITTSDKRGFGEKYGIRAKDISSLINKKNKSRKGWRLPENKDYEPQANFIEVKLFHPKFGLISEPNKTAFREKYHISFQSLTALLNGERESFKGWVLPLRPIQSA